jgi:hypothetical protein
LTVAKRGSTVQFSANDGLTNKKKRSSIRHSYAEKKIEITILESLPEPVNEAGLPDPVNYEVFDPDSVKFFDNELTEDSKGNSVD